MSACPPLRSKRSPRWRAAALVAGFALAVVGSGCASSGARAVLHLGMEDAPEGKRVYFPPLPETPRYVYAGQLIGEPNFRVPGAGAEDAATRLWRIVAGLDAADQSQQVLQRPVAGAVDERGRIFVSDASRQALYVFDERAGELLVWDRADGVRPFASPVGVAIAEGGDVLVADAELGFVARLDARGNPVGTIGRGLLRRPAGIARDPAQRLLYVADTYAHDVKVFDDEGRLVQLIGQRGDRDGEFNFPTHVSFARGRLYVTDTMNSRIQVFAPGGEVLERRFGRRGQRVGDLVRPKGVAVDNEDHVYVVESYHDHLLVFGRDGEFLLPIGGTGLETGRFYLPAGVWIDSRNRVYVADMFNGRVVVFQFLGGGG